MDCNNYFYYDHIWIYWISKDELDPNWLHYVSTFIFDCFTSNYNYLCKVLNTYLVICRYLTINFHPYSLKNANNTFIIIWLL